MALQTNGTIGHSEIMAEFNKTGAFDLSAHGATLIGKSASTVIGETDFYGASNRPTGPLVAHLGEATTHSFAIQKSTEYLDYTSNCNTTYRGNSNMLIKSSPWGDVANNHVDVYNRMCYTDLWPSSGGGYQQFTGYMEYSFRIRVRETYKSLIEVGAGWTARHRYSPDYNTDIQPSNIWDPSDTVKLAEYDRAGGFYKHYDENGEWKKVNANSEYVTISGVRYDVTLKKSDPSHSNNAQIYHRTHSYQGKEVNSTLNNLSVRLHSTP